MASFTNGTAVATCLKCGAVYRYRFYHGAVAETGQFNCEICQEIVAQWRKPMSYSDFTLVERPSDRKPG
jgi:hypothetical protein